MIHHRHSFAVGEMAMPLMETPEQQRIMDLEEQLKMNQKELEKTKSQLETAEIKLSDRAFEVEGLKNIIQSLVIRDEASYKKIQQNDHFKAETVSKFQMMKMEFDKKFDDFKLENDKKIDDLKEQISKRQNQEELQKLKKTNKKLECEREFLQKELSDSIEKTKWSEESVKKVEKAFVELKSRNADLYKEVTEIIADNARYKEQIEEFRKTDIEKDKQIQELEGELRQKECKFDELKNELSDVVDEFEKRNLDYEKLKKKYEEANVKLNDMDKLQNAMEDLTLKHSQLQLQQKQPIDDLSLSKELEECVASYQKYLDACLNKSHLASEFFHEYSSLYYVLSVADRRKFKEYCLF